MADSAINAIIASLIVISIYITLRFQWKFAVPVLIALMHDVLITGGVYALLGREVTASTVAALLTILGFSLYDTIVVFDRVRENIPRMPNAAFSQIYNRSMSEVIVRSLATSFCAALPILALMLFGGETLKDFAFALLVGTLSGTYSSVFIAGPVLTHWKEREPVYKARERRIREPVRRRVPAYAVADRGRAGRRRAGRVRARAGASTTPPQDPSQGVSRAEFDEMVRDLGIEEAGARSPPPRAVRPSGRRPPGALARRTAASPPASRPARAAGDGRRRRREAEEAAQPPAREAALMAALVWVMVGIALWHFTIFLPDHFWSGIVGAFLGAVIGSFMFGLIINGFTIPGQSDTDLLSGARGGPGRGDRHGGRVVASACARSGRTRPA